MRRRHILGTATAAALAAGALAVTGVFGSSHREAPKILEALLARHDLELPAGVNLERGRIAA